MYYCSFITSRKNTHVVLSSLTLSHESGFSFAIRISGCLFFGECNVL